MSTCENMQDRMPGLIAGALSSDEIAEVNAHINQCHTCGDYLRALQADDKMLCEFIKSMQPVVERIEKNVTNQIIDGRFHQKVRLIVIWRKIMESPRARVAIAAIMILAVLIGVRILIGSSGDNPDVIEKPVIVQPNTQDKETNEKTVAELELEKIRAMVAASDIDGLVSMLKNGQWDSKLAAANYLGKVGDLRAIEALKELSKQWQGEAAANPFARAIEQIQERLKQNEQGDTDAEKSDKPEKAGESIVHANKLTGVVKDEQGRPIPNAKIILYHNKMRWGLGNSVIEQVTSSGTGTFVLSKPLAYSSISGHSYAQDKYIIFVTHPNYALGWKNITQMSDLTSCEVILTEPTSKTITVTDHDGNALAGVRVWMYSAGDRTSSNTIFHDYLSFSTDIGLTGGTTGEDGKVTITNLPQTSCSFHATLKDYARGLAFPNRDYIRLSKGATVSGTVLDEEGKPVVGAIVKFFTNWGMWQFFVTETNSQGHFRLEDLPARGWDMSPWGETENADGSYKITVEHDDYICPETQDQFESGEVKEDFNLDAYRGTLIECHVVDSDTNEPIPGARIYGENERGRIDGRSDVNGVFKIRVMSGRTSLSFRSPPDGVYILEDTPNPRLSFEAQGSKMTVTLEAPPIAGCLVSVPGIVLGPDGSALTSADAVVYASAGDFKTSTASSYVRPVGVDNNGQFELKEVPAGQKLMVYAETKDHVLAMTGVLDIPSEPNQVNSLELKLEPTQSASLILKDEDGEIAANMTFEISPLVGNGRMWPAARKGSTDENGLLIIEGILPGLEYRLQDERFQKLGGRLPAGIDKWFDRKIILVPVEP